MKISVKMSNAKMAVAFAKMISTEMNTSPSATRPLARLSLHYSCCGLSSLVTRPEPSSLLCYLPFRHLAYRQQLAILGIQAIIGISWHTGNSWHSLSYRQQLAFLGIQAINSWHSLAYRQQLAFLLIQAIVGITWQTGNSWHFLSHRQQLAYRQQLAFLGIQAIVGIPWQTGNSGHSLAYRQQLAFVPLTSLLVFAIVYCTRVPPSVGCLGAIYGGLSLALLPDEQSLSVMVMGQVNSAVKDQFLTLFIQNQFLKSHISMKHIKVFLYFLGLRCDFPPLFLHSDSGIEGNRRAK